MNTPVTPDRYGAPRCHVLVWP